MCPSKRPFGFYHKSQIILVLSVWKKCVLCCCEFLLISLQKWGFYCYCQRGWNYVPLAYVLGVLLPSLQAVVVAQLVVAVAPVPAKLEFVWYKWLLLPVDLPWICDLLNLSAQVGPILDPPVMHLMCWPPQVIALKPEVLQLSKRGPPTFAVSNWLLLCMVTVWPFVQSWSSWALLKSGAHKIQF